MRGSEHDQLWNQIEAEIHLHRHKTVIRACRGRKDPNNKTPAPPPPKPEELESEEDAESKARKRRGIGEPRTVVIHKEKTEGLGISITVSVMIGSFRLITWVQYYFFCQLCCLTLVLNGEAKILSETLGQGLMASASSPCPSFHEVPPPPLSFLIVSITKFSKVVFSQQSLFMANFSLCIQCTLYSDSFILN